MTASKTVQIGNATFTCPCHACAFFHSTDEEFEFLLPYAMSADHRRERVFHIADKRQLTDRRARFESNGYDVKAAEQTGQLELRPWEEAYLRNGRFNQYAMLELIQDVLRDGRSRGFETTRLWANMEWALEDLPGVNQIVEYETRLNEVLPKFDDIVVCTYDLAKFSAPVVMDIMRTHPQVIIGGIVQDNPFFVPPGEFLAELNRRPAS